ncbi:MAG: hypothetical protein JXA43_02005 [Candidatus Diapherotrites archaeon]|nr:hypothetical protein [Candidatus Diapherotrites archaeon]
MDLTISEKTIGITLFIIAIVFSSSYVTYASVNPTESTILSTDRAVLNALIPLAIVICLIFGFILTFMRSKTKVEGQILVVRKILKEDEAQVFDALIANEGISQSKLLGKIDFSKAKLSQVLSDLENRNIVMKKKYGKENRVYIASWIK